MRFAHPQILWLLAVFPPLMLAFFWWSWRKRQQLVTQFIQARLLPALTVGISPTRLKLRLGSLVLAVICVTLALARPQWGFDWEPTRQRGLDILVAIDTSKSMLAEDIAPNRLTRAKLAALDLMRQAKSERLGLIAFAGTAFLQCPLTVDDTAFRQSVETLDVNIIPQGGTALAEVIQTALAAFKEGDNYKALVLLTDGEDHDSGAVDAAKKAAEAGLQIFAVGIGSAEGELLRIKDANGRTDYVRDEDGNVVKSHLNEELLKDIAKETQYGIYLRLQGAKSIETLYQQGLSRLPKSEHQEKLVRQYHERYQWPLALALILLTIEMLFPERKREPATVVPPPKPAKALSAATLLLLFALPSTLLGSTSGALREYKQGNYDQALKDYQKLLQRNAEDPRLHFNAGAAAYRDKKFDQAAKEFDAALTAPDLKLQELSYYNHGNTLFQLGAQNPDPTKKTETWKSALKDFESSLKLNPQDPDAKFNYEFVKKRLEEFQQQQQQQNKPDQNKQDQKDQQQQQNQQKQDSQKPQDQQKQSEQSKSEQNKDQQNQQAQQQKQEQEKQEQQKQQQAADKEKQQKEQQQAQQQTNQTPPQPQDASEQKEQKEAEVGAAGQMTPEQARQLLDAQKSEEQLLPIKPKEKQVDRSRHFKDW